ncbi:DUF4302 domain-containing protein [Tenacibaculum finnmarkense]|uniref:DUF4302 domain-containing protein n=1 Tax=Tenacibaculum finnmarkense TaxID=2781243 RepID=UPI000C6B8B7B|nr:DUF4302 domain-containing protein [Tenacibaculum finnmarkense]MBE7692171.1 DUF4302 domain-containing protein [Tenacibaculum finnmarkense genomovar finnmarkense]MCD8402314.1 DUF4302 domain-containing protein [Tenacibaculum finnmarkense genomovar finnmarkense]MCD8438691.1 DUF4302 domain-containing protein [Tenacibaculum finnmarkense genomovar ulcerans]MCG8719623.1 DUF4302 domain-containing protein [Tenacibaculum finnmarkense]MCG8805181.1 DUF4302 domain-containing protein [Tenacibaculum finnma
MKKTINKFLVFLLFVGVTISCNNNTEEAIFNEPTSVRIQKSISEYRDLLTSSENGWIIEYYPDEKQNIGGFNYGVKFNKDLTTEVVHENAFATKESNMFDVIANAGPLLTFNTYNWLTHYYANPNADDSDGDGGDYEFALTSKTADVITLTGAQSRNKMRMFKLTEAPEVYLAKVNEVSSFISGVSGVIAINSINYDVILSNRHIAFSQADKDEIDMAYHFTPTGIKLYNSITVDGNQVSEFTLDIALNQLISLDKKVVIDLLKSPIDFSDFWVNEATSTFYNDTFLNAFTTAKSIQDAAFGGAYPLSNFIQIGGPDSELVFSIGKFVGAHGVTFSGVLANASELSITKGSPSSNWSLLPWFNPMLDLIIDNSPYDTIEVQPKVYKLVSKANPTFWFIILQQ